MIKVTKILLAIVVLSNICSCEMMKIPFKRNALAYTTFAVPDGTPAFQAGYKAGCSAIVYARGNVFYRSRYDYYYDPKMIDNGEYKSGYSRGWAWCFGEIVGTDPAKGTVGGGGSGLSGSFIYPNGTPFDTNPSSVQNAWGGFFGSSAPNIIETGNGLDGSYDVWTGKDNGGTAFGASPIWSDKQVHFMGIW